MSVNYYPKFAELLNRHLQRADRSGAWLAQRLAMTPSAVTRWRNGANRPHAPEVVIRIADSLGIHDQEERRQLLHAAGYGYQPIMQVDSNQQNRPDAPIPTTAIVLTTEPSPPTTPGPITKRNYLQRLVGQYRYLPLRSMDFKNADADTRPEERLRLADVYVDLDTTVQLERVAAGQIVEKPLSVIEAIVRYERVIILGAPGSGKSTLVNHLAYCLANHVLAPDADWLTRLAPWPAKWAMLLPVPILLREVAAWLQTNQTEQSKSQLLLDYLAHWLQQRALLDFYPTVVELLRQGQALLLLDGLDEVPVEQQLRRRIKEMIADLPQAFPDTPLLVTCRVLSYQEPKWRLPAAQWHNYELAELNSAKIDAFIQAWYHQLAAVQVVTEPELLSQKLSTVVRRPDLWQLACNPLLLTVMALVHTHLGELPDARVLLYEDAIDILLWRWEALKLENADSSETTWRQLLTEAGLRDIDLKRVLWQLAYEAHSWAQQQRAVRSAADATADITELTLYRALREFHAERSQGMLWADKMIQLMKLRAGLLVESRPAVYTFPHRIFQEYLAACHLSTLPGFTSTIVDLANASAFWREVILLAVGRLVHHSGDIDRPLLLVGELCPENAPPFADGAAWRKVWLAGQCLLEVGLARARRLNQGKTLIERLRIQLTTLITHDLLEPRERANAATVLSTIGDPRSFAEMIMIPAGPFLMGGREEELREVDERITRKFVRIGIRSEDAHSFINAAKPQHHLDLPAFAIGKYPVTNGQYSDFVTATGYAPPSHWHGPLPPAELRNHPVVHVSWYDAQSYCDWFSVKQGRRFRLPTEAEWEKAARGNDGRSFAWGDTFVNQNSNTFEAGIGQSTAVGIFAAGASPYGCLDLCGNVYEWTQSLWGNEPWHSTFAYPYQATDGRETLTAPDNVYRIIRGGSFKQSQILVRCAYRDRDLPQSRGTALGFRLAQSIED